MAFASAFRRILNGSSTPSTNLRFCSTLPTLTSPKLFVSGLSRTTTDENLYKAFAQFGNLREAKVVTDRGSGRSRGFGFVTFDSVEEAEKAREGMNAKFLDGWVIFVDPAKPREAPQQPPPPRNRLHHEQDCWMEWLLNFIQFLWRILFIVFGETRLIIETFGLGRICGQWN